MQTQTESLSEVMHWFKTMTTAEVLSQRSRWEGFVGSEASTNRIVRDEAELLTIRNYIECNPGALWEMSHGSSRQEGRPETTTE